LLEDKDSKINFNILVVDNGSKDGAPAAIRSCYPDISLIALEGNRGWAGGNDAGIAWALAHGAEAVCLLNNDTILPPV
ncbi:MAG: glycosyltransferase, partial [Gemmataceae bacterium]